MNKTHHTIGLLGGGQLAEMILVAAEELNLDVLCLCQSPEDPAYIKHQNKCFLPESIDAFSSRVDIISFESEFFETKNLDQITQKKPNILISPKTETILKLRNKLEQKVLFDRLAIPQANFMKLVPSYFSSANDLEKLFKKFPAGFVLKYALGGYDGKGNFVVNQLEGNSQMLEDAYSFILRAFDRSIDVYAEALISFESEAAIMCFYDFPTQSLRFFPLVSTYQENNICKEVWGPSARFGLSESIETLAQISAKKIQNAFPDLKVFALEFFLTSDHKILINEMAPRVHNSGHYSQLFEEKSQFHNFIRSLLNLSIETPPLDKLFLMRNIIGRSTAYRLPKEAILDRYDSLYWYAKTKISAGRKMGHINSFLPSALESALKDNKKKLAETENKFWNELKIESN